MRCYGGAAEAHCQRRLSPPLSGAFRCKSVLKWFLLLELLWR